MKAIIELLHNNGVLENLPNFKAEIGRTGSLEVRAIGSSPNSLAAVSVLFLDDYFSPAKRVEMHLEITDLGWSPFYFRNEYLNFEGSIYRLNKSGKVVAVNHTLKRILMEVAESWDDQIREYGIENFLQAVAGGAL
jgi:hypothetical protein